MTLQNLLVTPDLNEIAPVHARLVCAMRYVHMARAQRSYCCRAVATQLGSADAVRPFHVFMDEAGHAWPDPIALNRPCQMSLSYDEMLLVDCATAAAKNEREAFDDFLRDMLDASARRGLWNAARRLMMRMVVVQQ